MFSRTTVRVFSPQCGQVRNMATLKAISMRLKSVTNIQKITKSMKMVAAAKYARAERELQPARAYGLGQTKFYESLEAKQDENAPKHLVIAMTSDRGLCGAAHSNIGRAIRDVMYKKAQGIDTKIVCVGDKSKAFLSRLFRDNILMSMNDIGKKPPAFDDAAKIAAAVINSEYEFDYGQLYFNKFKTVVSYSSDPMPLYSNKAVNEAEKLNVYDSIDADTMQMYQEFALASLLYYAMKESACTEQSQRMTAMDGASKNAGEMIDKLTLTFNRTRQAVITRELIEIISGAAALD